MFDVVILLYYCVESRNKHNLTRNKNMKAYLIYRRIKDLLILNGIEHDTAIEIALAYMQDVLRKS